MITTISNNTNKKIMALIEQLPEEVRCNDKWTYLRELTKEELLSFFGISYARGLLGQNFLKLRRLFSVDVGHPIFSASMSFNRLVFINTMISFDDANSRLIKPNMHTRQARGGLSKHLQNSITHILRVENDKVEQSPPNDDTPRTCKMCVIASHGKGHKSAKYSMTKAKSRCPKCQQPVCRKHTITVCESCT